MRRRAIVVASAALTFVAASPAQALAHGIGGRADLPVPLSYFIVGAGAAIVISFLALSVLWTEPRLQSGARVRPIEWRWSAAVPGLLRAIGVGGFALVVVAGFADSNVTTRAISPVLVWVCFWLVIPFLSAGLGNLWRLMSPWRAFPGTAPERPELLARIGVWPAVIALLAFTWVELVSSESSDPRFLALAALGYGVYLGLVTRWAGRDTGTAMADAFEVYGGVLGAMAPIEWDEAPAGRRGPGTTVRSTPLVARRGWLRGLPVMPVSKGLAAFVIVMIGTVTYDGLSGTDLWRSIAGGARRETWLATSALSGTVLIVGGLYYAASWAAARLGGGGAHSAHTVAARFTHTLVPIALAYAFAHYFTLVAFEGQALLSAASDPFGRGWNLFGTADWKIVYWLSPTAIWYVQVGAIVTGHIAGVVLAHDRALADFPPDVAVRTQYAMLLMMVALTSLGLFVLAG